jgi:hypothetical protein
MQVLLIVKLNLIWFYFVVNSSLPHALSFPSFSSFKPLQQQQQQQ